MRIKIKIMILIIVFLFLISNGCIFDSNNKDEEQKSDGNVIAEGHIYGEDIFGNIVIWTEEKSESRNLYYYDIQTKETHKFAGPINSGFTCDIYEYNILWIEIKGNTADVHLYNVNSKDDKKIGVIHPDKTLAVFLSIDKDNVIWLSGTSIIIYKISEEKEEELVSNISNLRGLQIENNIVVYIHDYYTNLSILNIIDNSSYTLEKNNITDFALSNNKIVMCETIYDPPNGGLHVGCEGSWDEYNYLYDLDTKQYVQLTQRDKYRARPDFENNYIIWMGDHTFESGLGGEVEKDWEIFLYDITTDTEKQITNTELGEYGPKISGNNVIWIESKSGTLGSKLVYYTIE